MHQKYWILIFLSPFIIGWIWCFFALLSSKEKKD